MHPELLHHSTTKAPDSGLKLGFIDIPANPPQSVATAQNTPSKARLSTPADLSSASFDFKFGSDAHLSTEAQKLMDNVREEAARIKAQMQAEREAQKQKDKEAEAIFNGGNAAGRRIARAKGKAGRFSDIHMAQFKKMDSIADHPSTYRGKPGFAQPTAQSLKRSGSKAGLDEVDRPRTAGKGTPGRMPPPFLGRPASVSPFKSIPVQSERWNNATPAKRARHSELHDVSASRPSEASKSAHSSALPRLGSSSLLSPTKASLARAAAGQPPISSPDKTARLIRTTSTRSLRATSTAPSGRPSTAHGGMPGPALSKPAQSGSSKVERTLPALPKEASPRPATVSPALHRSKFTTEIAAFTGNQGFTSRLPTFSGLKSILRSVRKTDAVPSIEDRQSTPKRPNTATSANGSVKRVDFTPSVKSRYAVKLAAGSPSPAKLPHLTPGRTSGPLIPYDSAAYVLPHDEDDDAWEDAESEIGIEYPTLPEPSSSPAPPKAENEFSQKAKEHNHRESKEFKSIFTTLHHPSRPTQPSTLTSVNTIVNQSDPTIHANKIMRSPSNVSSRPSPSTIRHVRSSGVTNVVQPFEDAEVKTMPHGLPGKKRRRASPSSEDQHKSGEDEKENRRMSNMPTVPGGWQGSPQVNEQDEGEKRGGKRTRIEARDDNNGQAAAITEKTTCPTKKPRQSSAREMAKNNAKERKGRGILSLSRLNMLSQPKQRD